MADDINSKSTVERLRALTKQIEGNLAEARRKHVVTINTLATEALELQSQYTEALEKYVAELEAEKVELTARLNDMILNHPALKELEGKKAPSSNPADAILPLL